MINVNGDHNDFNYRYKMPIFKFKIEGKGNGVKTLIVNLKDIGESIYRNPSYILKWFSKKLGTFTQINEKENRFILNGIHNDREKMTQLLYEFINKFVMCKNCNNPETEFDYKKEQIINCNACGYNIKMKIKKKIVKKDKGKDKGKKIKNIKEDDILVDESKYNSYNSYDILDLEIDNL